MNILRISDYFILSLTLLFVSSCGEESANSPSSPLQLTEITLSRNELSIQVGQSETISVTSNTQGFAVTWESSDRAVVQIENGTITAIGPGNSTITAKAGDATATCNVTVSPDIIQVDKPELNMKLGDSETILITSDIGELEVVWLSDDTDVAVVANGEVNAVGVGSCNITAMAGQASAASVINVFPNQIELDKTEITLIKGQTETLSLISDSGGFEVTWSSDDENVAMVDGDGVISALDEGQTTITAQIGDVSASCEVTITDYDVYVVGFEGATAKLWKNGTPTDLSDGGAAQAWAIDVVGEDVYVVGNEFNGSVLVAKLWTNGQESNLENETNTVYPVDIEVVNGDIYVAGFEYVTNGKSVAKVWVNGVSTTLSNPNSGAQAWALQVVNGDVYVVGYESNGSNTIAKVWKNGQETSLTDGSSNAAAYGIQVVGDDVYIVGNDGFTVTVWKNGVPEPLTDGVSTENAYDIQVVDNDIYVVGRFGNKATVWKNGVPTELTQQYTSSNASAIQVLSDNVFVSGIVYRSMGGFDSAIWENQEQTILSGGQSNAEAKDIFVKIKG